ncbi:3-isopropylmalate dehydratase small subunit [Bartonella japonica]|uniref:3-isopropylmalate dehydratase small subunit n=1 Tax=Bartonella japonica TaxID=357761 RepID=A0ABV2FLC8_9HYPH
MDVWRNVWDWWFREKAVSLVLVKDIEAVIAVKFGGIFYRNA